MILIHIQKLKSDVLPAEDAVERLARATFSPEQFQKLKGVMREYVLERNISPDVRFLRQMVRLFVRYFYSSKIAALLIFLNYCYIYIFQSGLVFAYHHIDMFN